MTIKFETLSGSLYEVDDENRMVRRLIGVKDPTPRQGEDGEWKRFENRTPILENHGVAFVWSWDNESFVPTARSTITSPIKRILDDESIN